MARPQGSARGSLRPRGGPRLFGGGGRGPGAAARPRARELGPAVARPLGGDGDGARVAQLAKALEGRVADDVVAGVLSEALLQRREGPARARLADPRCPPPPPGVAGGALPCAPP